MFNGGESFGVLAFFIVAPIVVGVLRLYIA